MEVAAFKVFLKFFYFEQVNVIANYLGQLLYLSDKYYVSEAITQCALFVQELLDYGSMCCGYEVALFHNLAGLQS